MHRRIFLKTLTLSAVATLAGCDSAEMINDGTTLSEARISPDTSVVFGRFLWVENGTPRTIDQSLFGWSIAPRLKRLQDGKIVQGKIDTGGHFRWALAPGTYVIDRINYRDPMTGNYLIVPKVAIDVPQGGKTYYAGTLRADASTSRDFFGVSGRTKFTVIDNYASEARAFEQAVGVAPGASTKRLMVQNDRLPDSLDSTPEAQLALTLLGAFF